MSEDLVEPKPSFMFFIKHLKKLVKIKLSNKEKIQDFLDSNSRRDSALVPNFEGYSGPMEEGMIYLMFSSEGEGVEQIDSVMRLFWVTSPDLNFHQVDSFLISENLTSKQWDFTSRDQIFKGQKKNLFRQKVDIDQLELSIEGKFLDGYDFDFKDKELGMSGELKLTPLHPEGVITYYNGNWAINPSAYQRFYDIFALKAEGKLMIGDREVVLSDARAIVEHSVGIFSTYNIKEWIWVNIQTKNTSVHLFWHPLTINGEILHTAEGAAIVNGKWYHFIRDDISITSGDMEFDEVRNEDVPINWNILINVKDQKIMELKLDTLKRLSWLTPLSETHAHYVTNYILDVSGKILENNVVGRATLEYLELRES